jgi:hypothetical protein
MKNGMYYCQAQDPSISPPHLMLSLCFFMIYIYVAAKQDDETCSAAASYAEGHLSGGALLRVGANDPDAEAQVSSILDATAALTSEWPGGIVDRVSANSYTLLVV